MMGLSQSIAPENGTAIINGTIALPCQVGFFVGIVTDYTTSGVILHIDGIWV
jgi:hypothetical protein